MISKEFVHITGYFNKSEAVLVGFGSYYLINRFYPNSFGQLLGLIEVSVCKDKNQFPVRLRSNKLKRFLLWTITEKKTK